MSDTVPTLQETTTPLIEAPELTPEEQAAYWKIVEAAPAMYDLLIDYEQWEADWNLGPGSLPSSSEMFQELEALAAKRAAILKPLSDASAGLR